MITAWLDDVNWFAIRAKRFREAIAAAAVDALGLQVYLPMVKANRLLHTVIRVSSIPLFPGYFFACFTPDLFLQSVEACFGVQYVIRSGAFPIPIEDGVIAEIRAREESDGLIRLGRAALRPGDRVSIQTGPFAGMMARVESELDDQKRVALFLETLWQARVVLDRRCVQLEAA